MSMRLERNIGGAAASFIARLLQRNRFRVFDLVVEIEAFANNLAVRISDDGADEWSGADLADALRREGKCSRHYLTIDLGKGWHVGIRRSAAKCL